MKILKIIINFALVAVVAVVTGLIIKDKTDFYLTLQLPFAAPPKAVFSVAWSIIYVLMATSNSIAGIYNEHNARKLYAVYAFQLVLTFVWPVCFFVFNSIGFSVIIALAQWVAVIILAIKYYTIKPIAAYLQIPYVLWLTFAIYLNTAIAILN